MKLTRLKLTGFKSFVETTEFPIEPGLSGVVGPNGCGKSNLVEALRWVMGESSYKNMRASGMEDVIFAGSGHRPARNMAEVALTIDNSSRSAPAAFNDSDTLEVTRRIERDDGSTYRINGKEVRARDVQLLFADAATGARSPALVRQGQISELIAARPQSRRRIVEDAAGIAGLHARRHEVELRLKAAEDNLMRLEDVLQEIMQQEESLRRQARQADRYRALAADIRKAEALLAIIAHAAARDQAAEAQRALEAAVRAVADATRVQAEAARAQAVAAHELPASRQAEAAAAAVLTRLKRALDELDAEERRGRERVAELQRRIAELDRDLERAARLDADAEASLERLTVEIASLSQADHGEQAVRARAEAAAKAADAALAQAEAAQASAQATLADITARREAFSRAIRDAAERAARHQAERERLERDLSALDAEADLARLVEQAMSERDRAAAAMAEADHAAQAARVALAAAREAEAKARGPAQDSDRQAQRLDTEVRTLKKLLAGPSQGLWPPIVNAISVHKGYETALGAALGDDLDASTVPSAPAHWSGSVIASDDPALPGDAEPLAGKVVAPAELARRLAQIGVVSRAEGPRLARRLKVGQRLVSREGDLWRWDGFVAAAEAPTPAARRLAEKNRLDDLERSAQAARQEADAFRLALEAAQAQVRRLTQVDAEAEARMRAARQQEDKAREALAQTERRQAHAAARRASLAEAIGRLAAAEAEARLAGDEGRAGLAALGAATQAEAALAERRAQVAQTRADVTAARATLQALAREHEQRRARLTAAQAEAARWRERMAQNAESRAEAERRRAAAQAEANTLAEAPDTYLVRRRALIAEIEQAEAARREAADRLADATMRQGEADRAARAALEAFAAARELRAGSEARLEAARQKLAELESAIAETLQTTPTGLFALADIRPGTPLPSASDVERRLQALRADRERLGAVNLRADTELTEVQQKRDGLIRERDDLAEAIRRLRQAIGALNREGRERLLAAFEIVNGHFKRLFGVLFGGGEAELTLIDAEDPLEAGLEILARPPGKKLQTMTLLSGGEQALTATALIFAVFLTNPSPICVLDEVDAPLDDANVERFCDLLRDMAAQTQTRFLVITHNPITMARMDRLFGVTMAERGVSQLVSVDLETAERIREAV